MRRYRFSSESQLLWLHLANMGLAVGLPFSVSFRCWLWWIVISWFLILMNCCWKIEVNCKRMPVVLCVTYFWYHFGLDEFHIRGKTVWKTMGLSVYRRVYCTPYLAHNNYFSEMLSSCCWQTHSQNLVKHKRAVLWCEWKQWILSFWSASQWNNLRYTQQ